MRNADKVPEPSSNPSVCLLCMCACISAFTMSVVTLPLATFCLVHLGPFDKDKTIMRMEMVPT
eukprot:5521613-Amphidinium_carterae.1